jgi:transposase InsO family protein
MVFQASLPKTLKQFEEYVAFLRNGILPSHVTTKNRWSFERKLSLWELNNDLLYLRATNDKPAKRFVPEWGSEFRKSLFQRFHDDDRHIDYKKTFSKISELHVGVTKQHVYEYVKECNTCKRTTSIKERDDLVPVVSFAPMEHLQMDLVDLIHYQDENNGFSWLLTIVCIFSKFLWAIPLKNKEAATVGEALVGLFSQWGAPAILQSDNGKEFVANVIKGITSSFGIELRHGRARHPMSQGQIERLNQTVGRGFTKMMWDENNQLQHVDWVNYLPKFVFSYNTTIREVFFGHKVRGIYGLPQPIEEEDDQQLENITTLADVDKHLENVGRIHDDAREKLDRTRKYMVKHGSVHRRKQPFEPGQVIAVAPDTDMNPATRKRKIQANYKDTATVIRVANNNHTLVARDMNGAETRISVKRARILRKQNEE